MEATCKFNLHVDDLPEILHCQIHFAGRKIYKPKSANLHIGKYMEFPGCVVLNVAVDSESFQKCFLSKIPSLLTPENYDILGGMTKLLSMVALKWLYFTIKKTCTSRYNSLDLGK